jgi:hypothetical protein
MSVRLCLKKTLRGFCSDKNVIDHATDHGSEIPAALSVR